MCKNLKSNYCNSDLDIWPKKSLGFFFLWVTISLLSMMKFHQSKLKLLCRNARSIYSNSDLNFSHVTSKIKRFLPLKNIYQCTKFDEIPPKQTKVIVRKPMYYGQADGHTNRQTDRPNTLCLEHHMLWWHKNLKLSSKVKIPYDYLN